MLVLLDILPIHPECACLCVKMDVCHLYAQHSPFSLACHRAGSRLGLHSPIRVCVYISWL